MATQHYGSTRLLPPRRARRAKPQNRQTLWLAAGGMAVLALATAAALVMLLAFVALSPERIAAGVQVADLSLGGKTVDAAERALQSAVAGRTVVAMDGDRRWSVSLSDLGVQVDIERTLEAAQQAAASTTVTPVYTIDLSQAQTTLISLSEQVNVAAVPGDPPQIGRALDIPAVLDSLHRDINAELADGVLNLVVMEIEPPELTPLQRYTGATTVHVVERGQELALIAREYGVAMDDIVALNEIADPDLLWVGQELVIPAAGVYAPSAAEAPPAPTSTGKSIIVDTGAQRIYAYENGQLVRSHLTSTGRSETPTVLGDYSIYVKYVTDDMSGPDYFLPQVPYVMYFYRGYGIHGTYWHNSFGRPMSHGCVNLPADEAEWFFNWAEVGTPVRVI